MKIAYLFGSLNRGGLETLMLDVFRNADKSPFEFIGVHRKGGAYEKDFQATNVSLFHIRPKHKVDITYFIRLRNLLKQEQINIVHAQTALDALIAYFVTLGTRMKIVTTYHGFSFLPERLTTFALSTTLRRMGHKVEIIDYYPPFLQRLYRRYSKRPWNAIRKFLMKRPFECFIKKNLLLSQQYETAEGFKNTPPAYSIYVVGSDTVWSTDIVGDEIETYLLDFVSNNSVRIAYAASLGGCGIQPQYRAVFEKLIPHFNAIALRETTFVNDIQKLAQGLSVENVLDPTLLLMQNDYKRLFPQVLNAKYKQPYIALFDLNGDKLIAQVAQKLKCEMDLPIVNIGSTYKQYADKNYWRISPEDWLNLIANAAYVCTNSFHGLAFSLIFERDFSSVAAISGSRANNNGRTRNLLMNLNLQNRYIANNEDLTHPFEIDYSEVNIILQQLREKSMCFLRTNINQKNI